MLGVVTIQQLTARDAAAAAATSAAARLPDGSSSGRPAGRAGDEDATERAVQRNVLSIALYNSARSVPLLLVAVGFIAWLGIEVGRHTAAVVTALLGVAVSIWRVSISRRYADTAALDAPGCVRRGSSWKATPRWSA